jgi:hypothetical protein
MAMTLLSVAGRPVIVAGNVWLRLATVYEIMIDMRGWPAGKVMGVTA